MGTIYRRGKTYWIKYYKDGKPFFESSRSNLKMVARELLKQREGDISQGKVPGVYFEKVKFDELAEDFLRDYKINKKKSITRAEISINQLKKDFEGYRVPQIKTAKIEAYIERRLNEGVENSTVNRELSALKRMLSLGVKQSKVDRVPYIPMLQENNIRKGFFEHGDFLALREAMPKYLKGFVTFAYKSGWRSSEISMLTWGHVDRDNGIVRLEPGEAKNDEGRTVYLDEELKGVFQKQWDNRKSGKKILPFVFPNRQGTDKIKRFDKCFKIACKDAEIGNRLQQFFSNSLIYTFLFK